MFRILLRLIQTAFNVVLAVIFLLAGAYGAYALWDNSLILNEAANVRTEMQHLKPQLSQGDEGTPTPSFEELLAVNEDVCGWISLEGTGIDYPILRGKNNLTYINTDVYGNFSLAGSIFLDSRCQSDMAQPYSLLYGHHMDGGNMFGDLDRYKQADFFWENAAGTLILPEQVYDLTVFACLVTGASDEKIFDPLRTGADIPGLMDHVEENALLVRQEILEQLRQGASQVLAMSTCASEFTDARTIVLAVMEPQTALGTGGGT